MEQATNTAPVYRTETCRRCAGSGEYRGFGLCYGCQGRGVVQVECGRRPLTPEEQAGVDEWQRGVDAREARARAREARRQARKSEPVER